MIVILIATGIFTAFLAVILSARTSLTASFHNTVFSMSVTVLGCGLKFSSENEQLSLVCGRWMHSFEKSAGTGPKKKSEDARRSKDRKAKKKTRSKLPLSTMVKIARAGIIFAARLIASVQYDEGRLDLQPVIANPALAGMAFGWGRAIGGAMPGLRSVINLAPSTEPGTGRVSGHLVLSIKNGRVVVLLWRLLRDLPIKEIIRYKFSKKR